MGCPALGLRPRWGRGEWGKNFACGGRKLVETLSPFFYTKNAERVGRRIAHHSSPLPPLPGAGYCSPSRSSQPISPRSPAGESSDGRRAALAATLGRGDADAADADGDAAETRSLRRSAGLRLDGLDAVSQPSSAAPPDAPAAEASVASAEGASSSTPDAPPPEPERASVSAKIDSSDASIASARSASSLRTEAVSPEVPVGAAEPWSSSSY